MVIRVASRGTTPQHRYFTEFTWTKAILYSMAVLYVTASACIVMLQPFIKLPCHYTPSAIEVKTSNTLYVYNPCRSKRFPHLLGLTTEECEFGRRLVWSVVFGCLIGWERRNADRPAGIRTMALVSLGSCLFSICSAFAFLSGPMSWDSSRISAAIPSGVGFLGSALIFKHKDDQSNIHEVHGLTTAASVWLSAAVGIACAGGMYYIASLSCAVMLVLLRFGPRTNIPLEEINQEEEHSDDEELADIVADKLEGGGGGATTTPKHISYQTNPVNPETQQLILPRPSTSASLRSTGTRKSNQTPRGQNHRPSLI